MFSQGTLVSSTNKIYHHDITDILLKVVLNTHNIIRCNVCTCFPVSIGHHSCYETTYYN
jgi:hypothetical protein